MFPWLIKLAEKKGMCGYLFFQQTAFPLITLAPGASFGPTGNLNIILVCWTFILG